MSHRATFLVKRCVCRGLVLYACLIFPATSPRTEASQRGLGEYLVHWHVWLHGLCGRDALLQARHKVCFVRLLRPTLTRPQYSVVGIEGGKGETRGPWRKVPIRTKVNVILAIDSETKHSIFLYLYLMASFLNLLGISLGGQQLFKLGQVSKQGECYEGRRTSVGSDALILHNQPENGHGQ